MGPCGTCPGSRPIGGTSLYCIVLYCIVLGGVVVCGWCLCLCVRVIAVVIADADPQKWFRGQVISQPLPVRICRVR